MLSLPETQLFTSLQQQQAGSEHACDRHGSSSCTTWSVLTVPPFLQFIAKLDMQVSHRHKQVLQGGTKAYS